MARWMCFALLCTSIALSQAFAPPPLAPSAAPTRTLATSRGLRLRPSRPCLVPSSGKSLLQGPVRGAGVGMRLGMEQLFQINNVLPLPFWLLMILAPKARVTRQVMSSYLPFIPLIFIYLYFVVVAFSAPGATEIFKTGVTLASLSAEAQKPVAMAAIWAHLVAGDLFVGRWVLFDGLRNKVFTGHSIVLCLLFCPLGLLSHLVTRSLTQKDPKDAVSDGMSDGMSDERLLDLID